MLAVEIFSVPFPFEEQATLWGKLACLHHCHYQQHYRSKHRGLAGASVAVRHRRPTRTRARAPRGATRVTTRITTWLIYTYQVDGVHWAFFESA